MRRREDGTLLFDEEVAARFFSARGAASISACDSAHLGIIGVTRLGVSGHATATRSDDEGVELGAREDRRRKLRHSAAEAQAPSPPRAGGMR